MNTSFPSPTAQRKHWLSRLAAATLKELFVIQVIAAVLVSVILSDLAGFDYPGWAALSSYAVMNTSVKASTVRAFNRVTGTVLGGVLALLLSTYLIQDAAFLVLFCTIVGGVAVWRADVSRWSYSWVLGAVTSMMVMAEAQKNSALRHLLRFTFERIEEVVLGCAVCIAVTVCFYPFNRRRQVDTLHQNGHPEPPRRPLLPLQAGITLLLVTPVLLAFQLTGFWQAMITVLAVFILPASAQPAQPQIGQRMQQRLYGCLAATLLSLILLPVLHHYPPVYLATLVAGLWLGCHLQQRKPAISYFGRQFTVAWIIVFIQETLWLTAPTQAVMRCVSILIAIMIIGMVMTVFRWLKLSF